MSAQRHSTVRVIGYCRDAGLLAFGHEGCDANGHVWIGVEFMLGYTFALMTEVPPPGADFALPADGLYVIGVVTTATVAASSHVHLNAQLQMRNA